MTLPTVFLVLISVSLGLGEEFSNPLLLVLCGVPTTYTNTTQSNSTTHIKDLPDRCPSTQEFYWIFPEIQIPGLEPFQVTCYSNKERGSGWMVVLEKYYYSTDLNRTYDHYINGFGNVEAEHFIGLEKLHILTSRKQHELLLSSYQYKVRCDNFVVGNRSEGYSLKQLEGCSGDTSHFNLIQGTKFSTFDRDEDGNPDHNWAEELGFGFWFSSEKPNVDKSDYSFVYIRRREI